MALTLGEHGRVRFEISELPRGRRRLTLEAVVAGRVVKVLDQRDYDSEPDMWRSLADFAADKQAEFALAAAQARRL